MTYACGTVIVTCNETNFNAITAGVVQHVKQAQEEGKINIIGFWDKLTPYFTFTSTNEIITGKEA